MTTTDKKGAGNLEMAEYITSEGKGQNNNKIMNSLRIDIPVYVNSLFDMFA